MDAGNWAENLGSPDGLIKTRTLLAAMGDLGYVAANVSERDLASGYDAFLELKKDASFPMVSANLVFQSTGKPIAEPYTIIKFDARKFPALKAPLRVAVIGVTRFNPTFLKSAPPKENVIIAAPADELKKYLPEMRKKADQVIVLAALPKDDAHMLAREVPGIDVIVGAYQATITAIEEKEGNTRIFYCGNQGKYLAELRAFKEDDLTELKTALHYLNADYPVDQSMQAKVQAALVQINDRNKTAAQHATKAPGSVASAAPPVPPAFLTAEACRDCHATDFELWERSGHAHAMQTLIDKKSEFNPQCVGCHVVAFQRANGFTDLKTTPQLANVQCEACHGAAARHVKDPSVPYGRAGPMSCVRCHNPENSPNFEFNAYWARIRHGR